ncbi:unnamed protein product, partial [Iphiclides podalirius]
MTRQIHLTRVGNFGPAAAGACVKKIDSGRDFFRPTSRINHRGRWLINQRAARPVDSRAPFAVELGGRGPRFGRRDANAITVIGLDHARAGVRAGLM